MAELLSSQGVTHVNAAYYRVRFCLISVILLVSWGILAAGQDSGNKTDAKDSQAKDATAGQSQADQDQDPLKRAIKPEQQKKAILEKESGYYKKWANEDVRWIITDQEMSVWKKLSNNAERDNFIENFWQRRDPTPDTPENEYKEEHYRRIAYANEHFAAGVPGWRTDRGRMWIMYGKPDSTDSHPMGGPYLLPRRRVAARRKPIPLRYGAIAIWMGLARKLRSSLSILAVVANIT